ncbi:acid phosphatase [Sinomonas cellulolyticus]|nr:MULTISPECIES: alkaline phosphatase family protein [Sinomonas]GHG45305.1 acid phosphatase [Sinomonas sp. KCTC 49339]
MDGMRPRRPALAAAVRVPVLLAALCSVALTGCTGSAGTPAAAPSSTPAARSASPGAIPRPDHIVIVVEENKSFDDVMGRSDAPYINSLAAGGALFTQATGVAHPSEPNYLALFSGSTQGVTDDSCPHSFGADSLGSQLIKAGMTFGGFAESLPSTGYQGCSSGDYARKHAPWTDFPAVPASSSQPFSAFPHDFATLPTVSIVVPNLANDMHNGSVSQGDTWLRDNLDAYAKWARTHNSLLIVTWDEDDSHFQNHIATIFSGEHVTAGKYSEPIDHYRLLATVEAAEGLPLLAQAAATEPVTDVWH